MQNYLLARWMSSFPNLSAPSLPAAVAVLRLAVMAQAQAELAMEAFYNAPGSVQRWLGQTTPSSSGRSVSPSRARSFSSW